MARLSCGTAALALFSLGLASTETAIADEPLQIRSFVNITLPQPGLSALCGFSVYRQIVGTVTTTLFLDDGGNPVHEIDTSPSLRNTYFSPDTGKSLSFPGTGTLITDYYSNGTAVANVDGMLTLVQVPGGGPLLINVGRIVFTADIVGTNADGVPVIGPPKQILFEAGVDRGSILGACQALAP